MHMKVFLCHATQDAAFVIEVARFLKLCIEEVFFFEDPEQNQGNFIDNIRTQLSTVEVFIVFAGQNLSLWQNREISTVISRVDNPSRNMLVQINKTPEEESAFIREYNLMLFELTCSVKDKTTYNAIKIVRQILNRLQRPRGRFELDLPLDPHLFEYEKDIIQFFRKKLQLGDNFYIAPEENWMPPVVFADEDVEYRPVASAGAVHTQDMDIASLREIERKWREEARNKLLEGCPSNWPTVERWAENIHLWHQEWGGANGIWPNIREWSDQPYASRLDQEGVVFRRTQNRVLAAALSNYHQQCADSADFPNQCMLAQGVFFPEAGPRQALFFPPRLHSNELTVAVLVSGGIAPGINAVIDGIVQRHSLYARIHQQGAGLTIYGLRNGLRALDNFPDSHVKLLPDRSGNSNAGGPYLVTSEHANEGGSMLGTSRVDELMDPNRRLNKLAEIVTVLRNNRIDILYIIGGDGSMKAAHAIWSLAKSQPGRPLSVVAVPKTMDNDVLWVWQAFGFLSAVEKAREIIEHLHTEVKSNPRLCILQLFGSDSGFVVSHSVLASATGHCDVALIPEVPFSMVQLAKVLKENMCKRKQRIPYGLVVMAETAIPTDAANYAASEHQSPQIDIGLTRDEQNAILEFQERRNTGKRLEGQTSDTLRKAGLKIVSEGLKRLIPEVALQHNPADGFMPEWNDLRVLTSEPRHLLRSVSPSCTDIIFAQRLGMLAVDNAMAGFTDFMISQWLTEYTVVPLSLVVLGRKRIPNSGIFWKSVLAKTHQPDDMVG